MKSVIILLSTYNGEKYLKEQIDSLLCQKNVCLKIIARDDGSKDSTVSILNEYSESHSNFSFYQGEHCGPAKSFLDLIVHAGIADYYAFCDQDDVWDDDKLIVAIEELGKLNENESNLYHSNLRIVDDNLQFYRLSHNKPMLNNNKYSALTENLCTGCTAVFNYKAKEIVSKNIPFYCTMHDTWIYMTCMFFGSVIYDCNAHLSYRQHSNNTVGTYLKLNLFEILKESILRLLNCGLQPRYMNALNFYSCFSDMISDQDKNKVLKIINYKSGLINRVALFFDKDIKASTKYRNLRFRFHILWGTV